MLVVLWFGMVRYGNNIRGDARYIWWSMERKGKEIIITRFGNAGRGNALFGIASFGEVW